MHLNSLLGGRRGLLAIRGVYPEPKTCENLLSQVMLFVTEQRATKKYWLLQR